MKEMKTFSNGTMKVLGDIRTIVALVSIMLIGAFGILKLAQSDASQKIEPVKEEVKEIKQDVREMKETINDVHIKAERSLIILEQRFGSPRPNR
tara:strand:- start:610 stop:891 length:282 start_codon:yes stop_codon:yes gene_type:complete